MSKVKLITEISKSAYDAIMAKSVLTPNEAAKAIDAILNSTPLTECDDCVSRQAVLNKAFEVKTGENTSAMVVYAEDIRKELPVKPKLAFNEQITTIPMPFE